MKNTTTQSEAEIHISEVFSKSNLYHDFNYTPKVEHIEWLDEKTAIFIIGPADKNEFIEKSKIGIQSRGCFITGSSKSEMGMIFGSYYTVKKFTFEKGIHTCNATYLPYNMERAKTKFNRLVAREIKKLSK